jgi:putative methionine-R-sulfoxide reductase with GAF domain
MPSDSPLRSRLLSSIRAQIVIGFGLILSLTLILVMINFFALQTVRSGIQATVDEAGKVREYGQTIQNEFLLARQEEKLFLDNWRGLGFEKAFDTHVSQNQWHANRARAALAQLDTLLAAAPVEQYQDVRDEAAALSPALNNYQAAFDATVSRVQERSQAGGQEVRLQQSLANLEHSVGTLRNSNELNRVVVQMSANEQAFFNTGEQQYIDQTRLLALRAKDLLNTTRQLTWAYSPLARPVTLDNVDDHMAVFMDLVALENEIRINTAVAQEVTDEVTRRTDAIRQEGLDRLDLARADLQRSTISSTRISVLFGLVALATGIVTALLLARRIIGPLTDLTQAAQSIGAGNLDYRVSITGQDEFATLGSVFNQMAGQLNNLIGSLEKLVADRTRALTTSFRVSRRLSTILDQNQLLGEVVEQVRGAFDYYHVHIYLFDQDKTDLIMVGGTGNAGRAMLASGHKIQRGRGLVGRAADGKQAVVVSDVTRDPGWLPNPLLPNTRSEIATPIMLGDDVLGVLDVQQDIRGGLTRNDAELLQSIANQVAIALRNAELYELAQRAAEREAVVNVINQRIQQAASLEGVLQAAAEEIGRALGAQETTIQLDAAAAEMGPAAGSYGTAAAGKPAGGEKTNGRASVAPGTAARQRPSADGGV